MAAVRRSLLAVVALGALAAVPITANARNNPHEASGLLHGYHEVPTVSTPAIGSFELDIARDDSSVAWTLSYANITGTVTQAHIHFAQEDVNGGIAVWLCDSPTNVGPGDTPTCPTPSGTVSGVIEPADVVGPAGQGIAPGEFGELLDAIRAGVTYANVHSSTFGGGEIRGQLR